MSPAAWKEDEPMILALAPTLVLLPLLHQLCHRTLPLSMSRCWMPLPLFEAMPRWPAERYYCCRCHHRQRIGVRRSLDELCRSDQCLDSGCSYLNTTLQSWYYRIPEILGKLTENRERGHCHIKIFTVKHETELVKSERSIVMFPHIPPPIDETTD